MSYHRGARGRPAYNHRYTSTDAELRELAAMLPVGHSACVLFNNGAMAEDARRFRRLLRQPRTPDGQ